MPRLVLLRRLVDGVLGEVGARLQLEVARARAEAHLRAAAESAGDGPHELDLTSTVERDASAGRDGRLQQRARLARAVDGDQLRRHAARQRGVQLRRPEDVATEPLLRQRTAHRERVVGLDRGQRARFALRPGRAQRTCEAARVAAQLILGDDGERRAEALGQLAGIAAFDLQAPARQREAVVDAPGRGGHAPTLCDLLLRSFAALTGRWSDGLIGSTTQGARQ